MYQQPSFYSFSEDSVYLAKWAADFLLKNKISIKNVVDLGAGCGVVGIEFFLSYSFCDSIRLVEKQDAFKSFLNVNCDFYLKDRVMFEILIEDIRKVSFHNADLILMNPPYFLQETNRFSPNIKRSLCRSIALNDLQDIWDHLFSEIKHGAYLIFCSPKDWEEMVLRIAYSKQGEIILRTEKLGRLFWIMQLNIKRD